MDLIHFNEYDKLVIRNACRPAWLSDIIPNKLEKALAPFFNQIFSSCCNDHDDLYWLGWEKSDFKKANKDFYFCMKQAIKKHGHWYSKWYFYIKAKEYYELVSEFGWGAFNHYEPKDLTDLPSYQSKFDEKIVDLDMINRIKWISKRWWLKSEL